MLEFLFALAYYAFQGKPAMGAGDSVNGGHGIALFYVEGVELAQAIRADPRLDHCLGRLQL